MSIENAYNPEEIWETALKDYLTDTGGLRCFNTFSTDELPENFIATQFFFNNATGNETTDSIAVTGQIEEDTFAATISIIITTARDNTLPSPLPSSRTHNAICAQLMVKMLRGNIDLDLPDYYELVQLNFNGKQNTIDSETFQDITILEYSIIFKINFKNIQ